MSPGEGGRVPADAEVWVADLRTGDRALLVEPTTPGRLRQWYCAGKPALALACAVAQERSLLRLDAAVSDIGVGAATVRGVWHCRLVDLFHHTAGLQSLDFVTARLLDRESLLAACRQLAREQSQDGPFGAVYAPVAGWVLAAAELERVTGEDYRLAVRFVLDAYGVDRGEWVTDTTADDVGVDRVRSRSFASTAAFEREDVVLLGELLRDSLIGWNPAFGCLATTSAMLDLLVGFAGDLSGAGRALGRDLAMRLVDDTVDLEVAGQVGAGRAGVGWLVDLSAHGFGRAWSTSSFGSIGESGCAFIAVDLPREIAVAAHVGRMAPLSEARRTVRDISGMVTRWARTGG